jgi:hypothetical protein
MGLFSFGNKKKSQGTRSGEYGGCGIISVLFLAKKSRSFWSKLSNFGTNFAATRLMPKLSIKIEWHEPIDVPRSSEISLTVIRRLANTLLLHFINFFVCCWSARASGTLFVVHIFSAFLKHFVPPINVAFVQSSFSVCHSQHSECIRALNFVFHTKFDTGS